MQALTAIVGGVASGVNIPATAAAATEAGRHLSKALDALREGEVAALQERHAREANESGSAHPGDFPGTTLRSGD